MQAVVSECIGQLCILAIGRVYCDDFQDLCCIVLRPHTDCNSSCSTYVYWLVVQLKHED